MRVSTGWSIVAAVLLLGGAARSQAEFSQSQANHFGRWIGLGWSEGYHAYDECPRCRHAARPCAPLKGTSPDAPYLNWQPLFKSAPDVAPPTTNEVLPPTIPALPPAVPLGESPPGIRKTLSERRALKPSQQMRPIMVPKLRPAPPLGELGEVTPIENSDNDGSAISDREVLPASAIRVVTPPITSGHYPLSR